MASATLGSMLEATHILTGACTACGRHIEIERIGLEALAARYGRGTNLRAVMDRITCKVCGCRADLRVGNPSRTDCYFHG